MDICNCHEFCLEKYHVIQCGYSIKCIPTIPQELYDHLQMDKHMMTSPFKRHSKYTCQSLNALKSMTDLEGIEEAIMKNAAQNEATASFKFCKQCFKLCLQIFKKPNLQHRLSINEASFNHTLIWPLMELAVDTAEPYLTFVPGEFTLKASSHDEYKCDATVLFDELEICLLETSGKFLLNDNLRFGQDHVKGVFGVLVIYNMVYKTYYHATEATAARLQIPFVHARHDKIHLWMLELCSDKLYILKKIYKCTVPKSKEDVGKVLEMGIFVWQLKRAYEEIANVVQKMKQEHEEYEVERIVNGSKDRRSLKSLINMAIKKPVKGAEYGILLPKEKDGDEEDVCFMEV